MADTTIRQSDGELYVPLKAVDLGDGTFAAAVAIPAAGGAVVVSGPLTDTQLRATAVPVSGPLTDAQLAARLPLNVGGHTVAARVAITRPADTTQYAVGDAWSNSTTNPTVPSFTAARIAGGTGLLTTLTLVCAANQTTKPAFTIFVFDTAFTALEDNAAVDLSGAEAARLVAVFNVMTSDWKITNAAAGASGNVVAQVAPVFPAAFQCLAGSQSLYVVVRMENTYTPTSGETLTLIFGVQQD